MRKRVKRQTSTPASPLFLKENASFSVMHGIEKVLHSFVETSSLIGLRNKRIYKVQAVEESRRAFHATVVGTKNPQGDPNQNG